MKAAIGNMINCINENKECVWLGFNKTLLQKLGSRLTPALGCSTFYNQNIICENVIALAYWEENTF